MPTADPPSEGDVHTYERTVSKEEVREFGPLSGDQRPAHTEPDEKGRLLVQGPSLRPSDEDRRRLAVRWTTHGPRVRPTGDTGETITCRWENDAVTERDDRYELDISVVCTNDDDIDVLEAAITGFI